MSWTWVAVVVGLVAGACSGASVVTTEAAGQPAKESADADASTGVEVVAVTEAVVDLAGGDSIVASASLLMAVDRGYAFSVVELAVVGGDFSLDGFVLADGEVVAPSGPEAGYITDKPVAPSEELSLGDGSEAGFVVMLASFAAPAQELGLSLDGLLSELDGADLAPPDDVGVDTSVWDDRTPATKEGYAYTAQIALLLRIGFSVQQIVESVIFDERLECLGFRRGCTLGGVAPAFGIPEDVAFDEEDVAVDVDESSPTEEDGPEASADAVYVGSFDLRTEPVIDTSPGRGAAIEIFEDVFVVEIDDGVVTLADGHAQWKSPLWDDGDGMTWCPGDIDIVLSGNPSSAVYTNSGFEFEVSVTLATEFFDCDTLVSEGLETETIIGRAVATMSRDELSIVVPIVEELTFTAELIRD